MHTLWINEVPIRMHICSVLCDCEHYFLLFLWSVFSETKTQYSLWFCFILFYLKFNNRMCFEFFNQTFNFKSMAISQQYLVCVCLSVYFDCATKSPAKYFLKMSFGWKKMCPKICDSIKTKTSKTYIDAYAYTNDACYTPWISKKSCGITSKWGQYIGQTSGAHAVFNSFFFIVIEIFESGLRKIGEQSENEAHRLQKAAIY